MTMPPSAESHFALATILIYARDVERSAAFYQNYFGFALSADQVSGLITLESPSGGARIALHPAAKSVKLGQVAVKLVFDVADIEAFKARSAERGLVFGSTHQADGYTFANTKDPDKNSIAISSRAYRRR
jgi:predicted enzyme related to lactoylglutathione lyase